jgi:arginyl-tRNA synthetase
MSAEKTRADLLNFIAPAVERVAPGSHVDITLERPRDPGHGDYATTVALQLSKTLKKPPRKIAEEIVAALSASDLTEAPEIAGPGFINFRLKPAAKQGIVRTRSKQAPPAARSWRRTARDGRAPLANPTGPLHAGAGRPGRPRRRAGLLNRGARGCAQFYNDAGQQVENLAVSVRPRGEIPASRTVPRRRLPRRVRDRAALPDEVGDLGDIRKFAVAALRREQDEDCAPGEVRQLHLGARSTPTAASGDGDASRARPQHTARCAYDRLRRRQTAYASRTAATPTSCRRRLTSPSGSAASEGDQRQGMDHHSTVTRVRVGPGGG